MKILRLRREETEYYDWLDPYDFLERLALPHYFALAAAEEGREGDTPTGLIVACVNDQDIVIEWLCVDTEHRGSGTGSALIGHLRDMAAENGLGLAARLTYAPDMIETMENGAEFLAVSGFVSETGYISEWMLDLHTVLSGDYFRSDGGRYPDTEAAEDVPPAIIREAADRLYRKGQGLSLYDITGYPLEYDGRLSRVIKGRTGIGGMLLIKRTDDTIFPVFLYAESDGTLKALLHTAADSIRKEMKDRGNVSLICRSRAGSDFCERLFGDSGYDTETVMFSI